MSRYDDFIGAINEAEATMRVVDIMADKMARTLKGRLRRVDGSTLKALKKELREFDSRTYSGKWKS